MEYSHVLRLSAVPTVRHGEMWVNWLLWVEEDRQGDGLDRLWAGRVKLQDDPIATAYGVFHDAIQKLETSLALPLQDPLF